MPNLHAILNNGSSEAALCQFKTLGKLFRRLLLHVAISTSAADKAFANSAEQRRIA